jgi:hypothetical protein
LPDILILKDVPADQVEDKIKKYKKLGATKIKKTEQADGRYTLRITFPD